MAILPELIADRGYEGWRSFLSLINSGAGFIIRMKSPSSNGILSAYDFSKEQSYVKADGPPLELLRFIFLK